MLEGFDPCGCWRDVEPVSGIVLAGRCCGDCLGRALDFLEELLYLDKVGSVSAPEDGGQLWLEG